MRQLFYLSLLLVPSLTAAECAYGIDPGCAFRCNCLYDEQCDSRTGACPSACRPAAPSGFPWRGPGCILGNVAYGKAANQSGIRGDHEAAQAVDGNTSPQLQGVSCAHLRIRYSESAWWRVDLGSDHLVYNITLFNTDTDVSQTLQEFDVHVSLESSITDQSLCGTHPEAVPSGGQSTVTCSPALQGRYVIITIKRTSQFLMVLTLCEVVVIGEPLAAITTGDDGLCHCRNGSCPGDNGCDGCKDWWVGDDCNTQIVAPYLNGMTPVLISIARDTATIRWTKIDNLPDSSFYMYQVFAQSSESQRVNIDYWHDSLQSVTFTIVRNLLPNTKYGFGVTPFRFINVHNYKNFRREKGHPSKVIFATTVNSSTEFKTYPSLPSTTPTTRQEVTQTSTVVVPMGKTSVGHIPKKPSTTTSPAIQKQTTASDAQQEAVETTPNPPLENERTDRSVLIGGIAGGIAGALVLGTILGVIFTKYVGCSCCIKRNQETKRNEPERSTAPAPDYLKIVNSQSLQTGPTVGSKPGRDAVIAADILGQPHVDDGYLRPRPHHSYQNPTHDAPPDPRHNAPPDPRHNAPHDLMESETYDTLDMSKMRSEPHSYKTIERVLP